MSEYVPVRDRGLKDVGGSDAVIRALCAALADYGFGRMAYVRNPRVLWHFGRPFARIAPEGWVIFGHVPECIITLATFYLSETSGRVKVLECIQEARAAERELAVAS